MTQIKVGQLLSQPPLPANRMMIPILEARRRFQEAKEFAQGI